MKMKWLSLGVLIVIDFLLLPSILRFPSYLKHYQMNAIDVFINEFSIIEAGKLVLSDPFIQKLWLLCQLIILVLIIQIFWNDFAQKKNGVIDGIGGPDAAGSGQFGTSRWQTEKEIAQTCTVWNVGEDVEKGGLIIGVKKNRSVKKAYMITDDHHSIIIGATRSGKTRRLVFPTIYQLSHANESMILTDPKGELYTRTASFLQNKGYNVICLDFRNPGWGNRWNPMQPVVDGINEKNFTKASEQAWSIAHMFVHQRRSSRSNGEPIWDNGAEAVIASLILAVASEAKMFAQKHMASVYKMLAELGETQKAMRGNSVIEYIPLNEFFKNLPYDHPARDAFATARLAPERTRGSFYATVASLLRLFSDPSIAYLTAAQDHDLKNIGIEKTAVFLIIPDEDKSRHSLAALYVDQAYQALVDVANRYGGRLPVRVNMILDEFGNMPGFKDFDTKLTVSAGRGIRWNLIVQDFEQLKQAYPDTTQTIKGNCHTWIYLLTQDPGTAKVISQRCGRYTVLTDSSTVNVRAFEASKGQSFGLMGRDLLTPDEVMRWPENYSLVIRARQYPARLYLPDLSSWPADKDFIPYEGVKERRIEKVHVFAPVMDQLEQVASTEKETKYFLDILD